jgi:hypothetical protein
MPLCSRASLLRRQQKLPSTRLQLHCFQQWSIPRKCPIYLQIHLTVSCTTPSITLCLQVTSVGSTQDAFYYHISQALQIMDAQLYNGNLSPFTSTTYVEPVITPVSNQMPNYYLDSLSPSLSPPSLSNSLTASPVSSLSPNYLDTPGDGNISPSIQYLSPLPSLTSLPQLNYNIPAYDESYTGLFGKLDDLFPSCGLEEGKS